MQQKTEDILKSLISANIERKDRNRSAERSVSRPEVKLLFKQLAEQSEGFLGELYLVIRTYGGSVDNAAALDIAEDAFSFHECVSDQAIIINWSNWEEKIIDVYQQVLQNSAVMDNILFEKIRAQRNELKEGRARIIQFRDLMNEAH